MNPCFTNKAAEPQKIFGLAESQPQNMKMKLFLLIADSNFPLVVNLGKQQENPKVFPTLSDISASTIRIHCK